MSGDVGEDKLITCVDCGAQFAFSARDQAFYQDKGYQPPRRCRDCREKRKSGSNAGQNSAPAHGQGHGGYGGHGQSQGNHGGSHAAGGGNTRHGSGGNQTQTASPDAAQGNQFKVKCTGCGIETTVPFKPDPNRPVYCRTCYLNRRK